MTTQERTNLKPNKMTEADADNVTDAHPQGVYTVQFIAARN